MDPGSRRNSSSSSDRDSCSIYTPPHSHQPSRPILLTSALVSVVELQTQYFPIQPRGATDIRDEGIPIHSTQMPSSESGPDGGGLTQPGKLKEPRDLYSTATLQHPLKWPVECQVIPEKIRHVDIPPEKLEPFYNSTGKEPQPQPLGVEMGTVVYDYQPRLSVDYFCRATVGGSQDLDEFPGGGVGGGAGVVEHGSSQHDLKFESRFESGNLAKAIKVTNTYYELYLRPDLYTDRHAQWFYFRIQNTRDNQLYRISIVNFNKPDSLYRYGLKVLLYSEKEALLNGIGWSRAGQNIAYFKNDISPDENGPYYTLTFNLKFRHNNDTVYLAQCYPYTYSTLQTYLKSIEDDEYKSQLLTIRLLCRSLAGNNVHVLTVTSPPPASTSSSTSSSSASSVISSPGDSGHVSQNSSTETEPIENNPAINKKPVIVISARVHPGETQSSYMMKGIIDFLTGPSPQAKQLRDRFIFKLIPMLNPDGVIVGNSRCCLLGQDLNRQYRTVLREAFPQIYHAKMMLRRLQEENGIFLYCDLHGHSRKNNVFIYGCENRRVPEKKLVEQVFPLMMHKNGADKFSFQNCKFKIQKNKEGTGRIFVWTLGVVNSYTLEISLGGSTMPSRQFTHFSTADYEACGRHFCETLLDYSDPSAGKESLRDRILQKLIDEGSTADEPKNVQLSDYSSLSNSETDGEGDEDDGDESGNNDAGGDKNKSQGAHNVGNNSSSNKGHDGSSGKGQLKRQLSIRKHHPIRQHTNKSTIIVPVITRKSSSSNTPDNRSPLPVHRASVDFTKMITKQRKLEEPILLQAQVAHPPPPPPPPSMMDGEESLPDHCSASFKRLTKFRRKSRKMGGVTMETLFHQQQMQQATAKCTTILFDDPFKPPGTPPRRLPKHHSYHHHQHSNKKGEPMISMETSHINGQQQQQLDWLSGTEDECDPYDRPARAPTIKITDCCNQESGVDGDGGDDLNGVTGDLRRMKLSSSDSESQIVNQDSIPQFSPFTPTLPVGKAYLHQTFYPVGVPVAEKEKSPKRVRGVGGRQKMTNSLSDTMISSTGGVGTSGSISQQQQSKSSMPSSRRSSISYLVSGGGNTIARCGSRFQATGSTMFGSGRQLESSGDVQRRRVSWTGTLTVSVPNVPSGAGAPGFPRSPQPTNHHHHHHQRKKSFRKSKSLNDTMKTDDNFHDNSSPGSVSLDKIPGIIVASTTSPSVAAVGGGGLMTRSSKWTSSCAGRLFHRNGGGTGGGGGQSFIGTSPSSTMMNQQQQQSKVKKRGKLKRSKHK